MLSAAKVQIIYGIIAIKKKNVFRLFGSFEEYNYLCRNKHVELNSNAYETEKSKPCTNKSTKRFG